MADLIDMHLSTFIYAGRLDYNLLLFVHVLHMASTEKDTDPLMSSCCIVKSQPFYTTVPSMAAFRSKRKGICIIFSHQLESHTLWFFLPC